MLLLFRFVFTLLRSRFRSRIGPLDESVVRFTALPHDCDLNFHLNAGRYVSFMDISRVELIGRMRLLGKMLRRGWRPVIGGAVVRYRRSVQPFERFDIRSRVVGWDEKWIYVEHILEVARHLLRGRPHAHADPLEGREHPPGAKCWPDEPWRAGVAAAARLRRPVARCRGCAMKRAERAQKIGADPRRALSRAADPARSTAIRSRCSWPCCSPRRRPTRR